jgi:hypothetical protein
LKIAGGEVGELLDWTSRVAVCLREPKRIPIELVIGHRR